jgi:hypothetical protein
MNVKINLLSVFLVTTLGCAGNLNAGPFSNTQATGKPQSPVSVSIQPSKASQTDENIGFIVRATSQISSQQFVIIVHPPKDMQLIRGELTWRGAVQAGQSKTLEFTGFFKQKLNQRILVNAMIESESGPRFSARASYKIPSSGNNVKALSETQPDRQPQGNTLQRGDHTVIEYPVNQ